MLPFQTQTLSIPPTKITNDTCKNFTLSLPTAKKQETIMYQTDSFKTSVTAVKAACTCKLLQLLQLLPDRWMIRLIMELIGNRSFTLTAANGKRVGYDASRIASHTGIRTGTLLFIIYTSDLSTARPRKYA